MNRTSAAAFSASAGAPVSQAAGLFRQEGFVCLLGALPESAFRPVTDFLTSALGEVSKLFAKYGIELRDPRAGAQVERLLDADRAKVPAEDRHVLLGHFPLAVRLDEALWRIPFGLADKPFLYEFLGAKRLFVHMPPTARFVLPGNVKAAVPAHQDISYNKHLGPFCVVWVPLVEIDRSCGGMAVCPRTQGRGELYRGTAMAPFARRPTLSIGASIPREGMVTSAGASSGSGVTKAGGGIGRFRPRPAAGGPGTPTAKHSGPASVCAAVSKTPTLGPPGV